MMLDYTKSQPRNAGEESLWVHREISSTNFGALEALLMEASLAGPGNTTLPLHIFSHTKS